MFDHFMQIGINFAQFWGIIPQVQVFRVEVGQTTTLEKVRNKITKMSSNNKKNKTFRVTLLSLLNIHVPWSIFWRSHERYIVSIKY